MSDRSVPEGMAGIKSGEGHPAAPRGGVEHRRCRRTQAFVVIGNDQLDAAQATIGQRAQEALPEGCSLGGLGGRAQQFTSPIGVDARIT